MLRMLMLGIPVLLVPMLWIAMAPHASSAGVAGAQPISVTRPSREVIFTNKSATHFATDTAARDQRSYAGLFTSMHESLSDYVIEVDGVVLEPAASVEAYVWPWRLVRHHANGLAEEVFLPDGLDALLVRIAPDVGRTGAAGAPRAWKLTPRIDQRWIWEVLQPQYDTQWRDDGTLCVHRRGWRPGPGVPPWLAVATSTPMEWAASPRLLTVQHPRDAARNAMGTTHPFEPGTLAGAWPEHGPVDVAFALGDSPEDAAALARRCLQQRDGLLQAKMDRVQALFEKVDLKIGGSPELDRLQTAYHWARASMDALIMDVRGKGIYAGFHWFPNYWSRDTFICLPGATLVTRQYDDARAILRSFLRFQMTDRASPRLGRLPNIVQPGQLQYAGVDGTWWYVRAAYRYVMARRDAGDRDEAFEGELAPALALMIDGAERMAVDEHGLLTHGDGETWMDAGGEDHPYSPRGNRAVEVEALYYNGLQVAQWLASDRGDPGGADAYRALAERTREGFQLFWDGERETLFDHLNPDGRGDTQIRPNMILALVAVEPAWPALLTPEQEKAVVQRAYDTLVLPYGVTSLDPADPAFHRRHLDLAHYPFDAAYHNGDVWYWLSGPMITALCRVGRTQDARRMLDPLVDEILDHGAVGAIREIRDGGDTGLTEEFGGATFQAWSLAEFLRVMHEDLAPVYGWN
jgi:hypothetical protein